MDAEINFDPGRQDASDATLETLKAIQHPISNQAQILVEVCSFVATGNVLRVQRLLHLCGEHLEAVKEKEEAEKEKEKEKEKGEKKEDRKEDEQKRDDTFQSFAVLGIAMIAMGEEIGAEMSMRQFNHLVCFQRDMAVVTLTTTLQMHYGDPIIRKSVPLALGLISASNPQLPVLDTLSKYSHDSDLQVALNAIFAMGLVGAGTNNARLAQMLRQLAVYYYKEPDCLFAVRVAQGLVHMGKGTIGISPFFSDRNILSRPAIAGLLATIMAFTDAKACELVILNPNGSFLTYSLVVVLDKYHWMLYFLVTAMYPRFLITLNEDLESLPVTVRVGQVCAGMVLEVILPSRDRSVGRGHCRPSRQAPDNLRFPDSSDTCTVRDDRKIRVGNRGVYSLRTCSRRFCHPPKKPRMGGHHADVDLNLCTHCDC